MGFLFSSTRSSVVSIVIFVSLSISLAPPSCGRGGNLIDVFETSKLIHS